METRKTIYTTPDGIHLRYAYYWDSKGDKYSRFRRYSTTAPKFQELLDSDEKRKLPQLELESSFKYPILCADIDELGDFSSFDHMEQYYQQKYGDIGLVLRSPSGKVKLLFQFKIEAHLNRFDREASLESILEPEDFAMCDLQPFAMTKIFLTRDMFTRLSTWEPKVICTALLKAPERPRKSLAEMEVEYTHQNLLDSIQDFSEAERECYEKVRVFVQDRFKKMEEDRVALWAGYLVRYRKALMCGMNLNQGIAAQMIGVSQAAVFKFLNILNKEGFLVKQSNSYCPGLRAQKRRAESTLRDLLNIAPIISSTSNLSREGVDKFLDSDIPAGDSNQYYMKACRLLSYVGYSQEEALEILVDKDKQRSKKEQRERAYFVYLTEDWYSKRA